MTTRAIALVVIMGMWMVFEDAALLLFPHILYLWLFGASVDMGYICSPKQTSE